jgi:plastocyanin
VGRAAFVVLIAAVLAGGCGSSGSGDAPSQPAAKTPKPDVTVLMKGEKFSPKRITIHSGQTVEWIDKDLNDHSVVSSTGLASPDFAQGETWTHTFTRRGVLRYYDRLNPKMKGTVVIRR